MSLASCDGVFPRGDLKHRVGYGVSPADGVHCLANIAYGLEAIHWAGFVHRDLKLEM